MSTTTFTDFSNQSPYSFSWSIFDSPQTHFVLPVCWLFSIGKKNWRIKLPIQGWGFIPVKSQLKYPKIAVSYFSTKCWQNSVSIYNFSIFLQPLGQVRILFLLPGWHCDSDNSQVTNIHIKTQALVELCAQPSRQDYVMYIYLLTPPCYMYVCKYIYIYIFAHTHIYIYILQYIYIYG